MAQFVSSNSMDADLKISILINEISQLHQQLNTNRPITQRVADLERTNKDLREKLQVSLHNNNLLSKMLEEQEHMIKQLNAALEQKSVHQRRLLSMQEQDFFQDRIQFLLEELDEKERQVAELRRQQSLAMRSSVINEQRKVLSKKTTAHFIQSLNEEPIEVTIKQIQDNLAVMKARQDEPLKYVQQVEISLNLIQKNLHYDLSDEDISDIFVYLKTISKNTQPPSNRVLTDCNRTPEKNQNTSPSKLLSTSQLFIRYLRQIEALESKATSVQVIVKQLEDIKKLVRIKNDQLFSIENTRYIRQSFSPVRVRSHYSVGARRLSPLVVTRKVYSPARFSSRHSPVRVYSPVIQRYSPPIYRVSSPLRYNSQYLTTSPQMEAQTDQSRALVNEAFEAVKYVEEEDVIFRPRVGEMSRDELHKSYDEMVSRYESVLEVLKEEHGKEMEQMDREYQKIIEEFKAQLNNMKKPISGEEKDRLVQIQKQLELQSKLASQAQEIRRLEEELRRFSNEARKSHNKSSGSLPPRPQQRGSVSGKGVQDENEELREWQMYLQDQIEFLEGQVSDLQKEVELQKRKEQELRGQLAEQSGKDPESQQVVSLKKEMELLQEEIRLKDEQLEKQESRSRKSTVRGSQKGKVSDRKVEQLLQDSENQVTAVRLVNTELEGQTHALRQLEQENIQLQKLNTELVLEKASLVSLSKQVQVTQQEDPEVFDLSESGSDDGMSRQLKDLHKKNKALASLLEQTRSQLERQLMDQARAEQANTHLKEQLNRLSRYARSDGSTRNSEDGQRQLEAEMEALQEELVREKARKRLPESEQEYVVEALRRQFASELRYKDEQVGQLRKDLVRLQQLSQEQSQRKTPLEVYGHVERLQRQLEEQVDANLALNAKHTEHILSMNHQYDQEFNVLSNQIATLTDALEQANQDAAHWKNAYLQGTHKDVAHELTKADDDKRKLLQDLNLAYSQQRFMQQQLQSLHSELQLLRANNEEATLKQAQSRMDSLGPKDNEKLELLKEQLHQTKDQYNKLLQAKSGDAVAKQIHQLNSELEELRPSSAKANELEAVRLQQDGIIKQLKEQIDQLQKSLTDQPKRRSRYSSQKGESGVSQKEESAKSEQYQRLIESYEEEVARGKMEQQQLEQRVRQQEEQAGELRRQVREHEEEVEEYKGRWQRTLEKKLSEKQVGEEYERQVEELGQKVRSKQRQVLELMDEVDRLRAKEVGQEQVARQYKEYQEDISALKLENAQLREEVEKAEGQNAHAKEINALNESIVQLQNKNIHYQQLYTDLEKKYHSLQDQNAQLLAQGAGKPKTSQPPETVRDSQQHSQLVNQLQAQLASATDQLAQRSAHVQQLQADLERNKEQEQLIKLQLQSQLDQLSQQLARKSKDCDDLAKDRAFWKEKHREVVEHKDRDLAGYVQDLQEKLNHSEKGKQHQTDLEQELANLKKMKDDLTSQNSQLLKHITATQPASTQQLISDQQALHAHNTQLHHQNTHLTEECDQLKQHNQELQTRLNLIQQKTQQDHSYTRTTPITQTQTTQTDHIQPVQDRNNELGMERRKNSELKEQLEEAQIALKQEMQQKEQLQRQVKGAEAGRESERKEMEQLKQEVESLGEELRRAQEIQAEQQIQSSQAIRTMNQKMNQLQQQHSLLQMEEESLKQQCEQLEQELGEAGKQQAQVKQKYSLLVIERDKKNLEIAQLQNQLEEYTQQEEQTQHKISSIESERKKSKDESIKLASQNQIFQIQLEQLQTQNKEFEAQIQALIAKKPQQQSQLIQQLSFESESSKQENNQLKADLDKAQQELHTQHTLLKTEKEKLSKAEQQNQELHLQLALLQDSLTEQTKHVEELIHTQPNYATEALLSDLHEKEQQIDHLHSILAQENDNTKIKQLGDYSSQLRSQLQDKSNQLDEALRHCEVLQQRVDQKSLAVERQMQEMVKQQKEFEKEKSELMGQLEEKIEGMRSESEQMLSYGEGEEWKERVVRLELKRQKSLGELKRMVNEMKRSLITSQDVEMNAERRLYEQALARLKRQLAEKEQHLGTEVVNLRQIVESQKGEMEEMKDELVMLSNGKAQSELQVSQLGQMVETLKHSLDRSQELLASRKKEKDELLYLVDSMRREQSFRSPRGSTERREPFSANRQFTPGSRILTSPSIYQQTTMQHRTSREQHSDESKETVVKIQDLDAVKLQYQKALNNIYRLEQQLVQKLEEEEVIIE